MPQHISTKTITQNFLQTKYNYTTPYTFLTLNNVAIGGVNYTNSDNWEVSTALNGADLDITADISANPSVAPPPGAPISSKLPNLSLVFEDGDGVSRFAIMRTSGVFKFDMPVITAGTQPTLANLTLGQSLPAAVTNGVYIPETGWTLVSPTTIDWCLNNVNVGTTPPSPVVGDVVSFKENVTVTEDANPSNMVTIVFESQDVTVMSGVSSSTASTSPMLGSVVDGDPLASAATSGVYNAGTGWNITGTIVEWFVDGLSVGATAPTGNDGEDIYFTETVSAELISDPSITDSIIYTSNTVTVGSALGNPSSTATTQPSLGTLDDGDDPDTADVSGTYQPGNGWQLQSTVIEWFVDGVSVGSTAPATVNSSEEVYFTESVTMEEIGNVTNTDTIVYTSNTVTVNSPPSFFDFSAADFATNFRITKNPDTPPDIEDTGLIDTLGFTYMSYDFGAGNLLVGNTYRLEFEVSAEDSAGLLYDTDQFELRVTENEALTSGNQHTSGLMTFTSGDQNNQQTVFLEFTPTLADLRWGGIYIPNATQLDVKIKINASTAKIYQI